MRIVVALLVLAVTVYAAIRLLQHRGAVRGGAPAPPPPAPLSPRAEQEFRRAVRERAERQRSGTPEPAAERAAEPPPSRVVIDDDVFGPDEWGDPGSEHFVVISPAPPAEVAAAVARASGRFMLVDELGREHADYDAAEVACSDDAGGDLYTPNHVAAPRLTPHGVEGYVDCKGAIAAPMGVMFTRILREELERLGAPAHVRVPDRT